MISDLTTPVGPNEVVLWDIAFVAPFEESSCAPNPWKARYALNFKGVDYKTRWTPMPDITQVRQSLGLSAGRKFADGTDFHTLPIVCDAARDAVIGDSFDIAYHLQSTFPDSGAGDLFPPQPLEFICPIIRDVEVPLSERHNDTHADYARFNMHIDMAFTLHVQLCVQGMQWDPKWEDYTKKEFLRRVGKKTWDEFGIHGEKREAMRASLKEAIKGLATMYQKDEAGPFLLGKKPSYADVIVGGWLRMYSKNLKAEEWEEMAEWYDGIFGRLLAAMQEHFGEVKV